ncbi:MAG: hypothetical protein LBU89_12930 [Fibromonadaceae bacterium]|jgi:flagellin|nr:hypothetical protein [Fibromonadaceae bacterium]
MSNTLFNVSSMMYQSKLRLHNKALAQATERLATGSRINNAKDDPFRNYESSNAGSDIRNTGKARQNSADGAALLQMAEGACSELHSILQRVKELSVQSANDTLTSTQRHFLDLEANELLKEVDRITSSTTFNSKVIFGSFNDSFSGENRDLKDWNPFIRSDSAGNEIRAGILHIGPSVNPDKPHDVNAIKVSIPELSARSLGLITDREEAERLDIKPFTLTYQGGASRAIDDLDAAISSINTVRTYMGSLVNRLDRQVEDLEVRNINSNDHVSRIKDADFAKESTNLLTAQIKQQAAISILAQSNSRVGRVLEILG